MRYMEAYIDGFRCEVLDRTSDIYSRSIIERQVVGFDGPKLEDTGLAARTYKFEAVFSGVNYLAYDAFIANYKTSMAVNTLTHPRHGLLAGKIKSIDEVINSKEKETVRITVDFVEEGVRQNAPSEMPRVSPVAKLINEVAPEIMDGLALVSAVTSRIGAIEAICNQWEARVNQMDGLANNLVRTIVFPTSIPGKAAQLAFKATASAERQTASVLESPKNMIVGFLEHTRLTAELLARQDEVFGKAVKSAGVYLAAFLAVNHFADTVNAGQYNTASDDTTVKMNKRDIEESVNIIRREIAEIAKTDKAGTTQLQKTGLVLAEEAAKALSALGGERAVEVKREISIYAVLLDNRINRSRAAEICLRNNIENPNRVIGTIYLPESDY